MIEDGVSGATCPPRDSRSFTAVRRAPSASDRLFFLTAETAKSAESWEICPLRTSATGGNEWAGALGKRNAPLGKHEDLTFACSALSAVNGGGAAGMVSPRGAGQADVNRGAMGVCAQRLLW